MNTAHDSKPELLIIETFFSPSVLRGICSLRVPVEHLHFGLRWQSAAATALSGALTLIRQLEELEK